MPGTRINALHTLLLILIKPGKISIIVPVFFKKMSKPKLKHRKVNSLPNTTQQAMEKKKKNWEYKPRCI